MTDQTDRDPHAAAIEFMRDNYPATLAALRRTVCPVDQAPMLYAGPLDDAGPPVFYCPNGHGHWSTNGRASAWYVNLGAAAERRRTVAFTWETEGPADPAAPFGQR